MKSTACYWCPRRNSLWLTPQGELTRFRLCRDCLATSPEALREVVDLGLADPAYPPEMPAVFRATNPERLPDGFKGVLDWRRDAERSGLILSGVSGTTKTRTAWEIVRRRWVPLAMKGVEMDFEFLSMREFEGRIEKGHSESKHSQAISRLVNVPLLVLDDLGKEKQTASRLADLFAVIDGRSIELRDTIITTNYRGNELDEKWRAIDKETGPAIVRRLKDYYKHVPA